MTQLAEQQRQATTTEISTQGKKRKVTREQAQAVLEIAQKEYDSGNQTPSKAIAYHDALMQRAKFGEKQERLLFKLTAISLLETTINELPSESKNPVEQITRYNIQKKIILGLQAVKEFDRALDSAHKLAAESFVTKNDSLKKEALALVLTSVVGSSNRQEAIKTFEETFKEIDKIPKDLPLTEKVQHYEFLKKLIDDCDANSSFGRRFANFFGTTEKYQQIERVLLTAQNELKKVN